MPGRMDCYGQSHIGHVRDRNEDQFLIADLRKLVTIHHTSLSYDDETELFGGSQAKLMLVADGVGGSAAGERASSLALEGVIQYLLNAMHWIFRPEDEREDTFMEDLKSALSFSQERIQHAAEAMPSQHGMGTTITINAKCCCRSVDTFRESNSHITVYRHINSIINRSGAIHFWRHI